MNPEFWKSRWEQGQTGWHLDRVNPHLTTYWSRLKAETGAIVFIPLCGKSVDMAWLAERGYRVVGNEISERGVREFFDEWGRTPQITEENKFKRYTSGPVEIWQGDFFNLDTHDFPTPDVVYDRAALVALPPDQRIRYADKIEEVTRRDTEMLLMTFEYEQQEMDGPPYSVPEAEVDALFSKRFEIDRLQSESVYDRHTQFHKKGLESYMLEKVYHLSPRDHR